MELNFSLKPTIFHSKPDLSLKKPDFSVKKPLLFSQNPDFSFKIFVSVRASGCPQAHPFNLKILISVGLCIQMSATDFNLYIWKSRCVCPCLHVSGCPNWKLSDRLEMDIWTFSFNLCVGISGCAHFDVKTVFALV